MNPEQPSTASMPQKNKKIIKIVAIIAASLLGLFLVFQAIMMFFGGSQGGLGGSQNALFFDMLQTTAQKTKVQQLTRYDIWPAGADTEATAAKDSQLTLSEFDSASKQFSTVNATNQPINGAERCINRESTTYAIPTAQVAKGLLGAINTVNDPNAQVRRMLDSPYNPCNLQNTKHTGKFSDGIIPVGVTADQAKSWIAYLKGKDVFKIEDKGATTHKGKSVRKVEIATTESRTTTNIFYAVRDGDQASSGTGIDWKLQFGYQLSASLSNPGSLSGFYLIDEATKLPVYSEFRLTGVKTADPAKFEPIVQKVEYSYPSQLTLSKTSQLPML